LEALKAQQLRQPSPRRKQGIGSVE
jgi:hypothetical protein